jgi:L-2-hydroxyglutarate oxidase LhgO
MPEQTHFDLVIGGAGISGLLIGYELSKTKKVLVIEANDI